MDNYLESALGKKLVTYLNNIHEVYQPQKLFDLIEDSERYHIYEKALKTALGKKTNAHVLQTERGSILLSMEAVRLGAQRVIQCEPWDSLASLYETIIAKNGLEERIVVVRKRLIELNSDDQILNPAPDILICHNLDAGLLGDGLVNTLKHAWEHILPEQAQVIPKHATVRSCPVELLTHNINGFDLSGFNHYRWSLFYENIRLGEESYLQLAEPQVCLELDFTSAPSLKNKTLRFICNNSGICNAVAFWLDLDLDEHHRITTTPPTPATSSWRQALQYLDKPLMATRSNPITLAVAVEPDGLCFCQSESGSIPLANRLKPVIAHWHFPMLADKHRNDAYERAISRAVQHNPSAHVLEIGTGTGLLSMMAARAGAKNITACERIPHMAEIAQHHFEKNGFRDQIHVVNKESINLDVPGDMPQQAQILISETLDHSLLGEGFLPSLIDARSRLMDDGSIRIIPSSATVFAMALELRVDTVAGFDLNALNLFRRRHYQGMRLKETNYRALTDPFETFRFNFYDRSFEPRLQHFLVPATQDGICNAIAFWYHLHLDEETEISTAPDSDITAWEQAIIFLDQEFAVEKGQSLPISGQHDLDNLQFFIEPFSYMLEGGHTLPQHIPEWFKALTKKEEDMRGYTQSIHSYIRNEYTFVTKATFEQLITSCTKLGFDLNLFSDFITQIYYTAGGTIIR